MVLVIDATIRNESRTRVIGEYLVNKFIDRDIEWLSLDSLNLKPLDEKMLKFRDEKIGKRQFDDPYFDLAKQLLRADKIVILAPFYDLSFPSALKCYLEHVSIANLVFRYVDNRPVGNLKANSLYYVVTSGGPIFDDSFGYGYVSSMFEMMYGVKKSIYIKCENLDIVGADIESMMNETKSEIDKLEF